MMNKDWKDDRGKLIPKHKKAGYNIINNQQYDYADPANYTTST